MGLLSNLDEAAKIQAPKAMKEIYSFYKEYRGRDLEDADWKELTEKARQICAGWEENEWVRRIVLEMISLLDSDDAERRRIALEVEKEMEAAEQKMKWRQVKSKAEARRFFSSASCFYQERRDRLC